MLKRQAFEFLLVITIMAIVAPACTSGVAGKPENLDPVTEAQQTLVAATQNSIDPVAGAQQTIAAATQKGLDALAAAQETIAAADPSFLIPVSGSSGILAGPDDQTIKANFTGRVICSQFEINLLNGSTTMFKSMVISISIKDDPSRITVTSSTNGFLGHDSSQTNTNDNCKSPASLPNLNPGASYTVFFPKFTEKVDSAFEGSLILCTENDLGGQCSKTSIVFAPNIELTPSLTTLLSSSVPTAESISSPESSPLPPEIFTADYVNTVNPCPETWWVRVNLTNKFNTTLKSMSISVKDTVTGTIALSTESPNVFTDQDPSVCHPGVDFGDPTGRPDLEPNTSVMVSSGVLPKDPKGDVLEATIKVCTEEDLTGQCSEKTISFTPSLTAQPTVDTTKPTFPYIILSAGTNCRTGPGVEYDLVGAYAADTKIPVLGKDSAKKYWVVASPYKNDNNPKCWLDGRFVKESGNLGNVETYPVPPTPTSTPKPPTATSTVTSTTTLTPTP
jgi:hypothetical protein